MSDKTDHDILTEHGIILKSVCKKLDKILEKIDDNVKTYITKRMFLAINSIIIFLVISLFAYTSTIQKQVIENTVNVSNIQKLIEK